MKKFETIKRIKYVYGLNNCRSCGYCSLQNLLTFVEPEYYHCGVYGWNFDAYVIDGMVITTGYRSTIGVSLKKCDVYDKKAFEVLKDNTLSDTEKREKINSLLKEFINLNK